jgi:hypothetical protein
MASKAATGDDISRGFKYEDFHPENGNLDIGDVANIASNFNGNIGDVASNFNGNIGDVAKLAKVPTDFNNIQGSLSSVSSNNISTDQLANFASQYFK